jgi:hypothetical protein
MFAYCVNNPINHVDPTGEFSWLVLGIIVCAGVIGAISGYSSDEKLSPAAQEKIPSTNNLKHPSEITEEDILQPKSEESKELTTGDRAYNAFLGAVLGTATGGLLVSGMGALGSIAVGSGAAFIPAFGATGMQTFAFGAVVYDFLGMVFGPLLGLELESIEVEP